MFRDFLKIFLPATVLLTSALGVFLYLNYGHHVDMVVRAERQQIATARHSIRRDLEVIAPDLEFLAQNADLKRFLFMGETGGLERYRKLIREFLATHPRYLEACFIDTSGQELARATCSGDGTRLHAQSLRDRHKDVFFKQAMALPATRMLISELEPYTPPGQAGITLPVIRFARTVFLADGRRGGIVILTYDARLLERHFEVAMAASQGHVSLLTRDGHWLYSHRPQRRMDLRDHKGPVFADVHPDIWSRIRGNEAGVVMGETGIFTYTTFYPYRLFDGSASLAYRAPAGDDRNTAGLDRYFWKIVSDVPRTVLLQKLREDLLGSAGLTWLTGMLFAVLIAWLSARASRARRMLERQQQLHAMVFENTQDGVLITDERVNIIDVNEAFSRITGYSREAILGENPRILASGQHDKAFYASMWKALLRDGHWEGEITNRRRNGEIYEEWLRISELRDAQGRVTNYIGIITDITARKQSERELLEHARTDPLTGLPNRLSFDDQLQREMRRTDRLGKKLAVLFIDLNKFKPINDKYGHRVGDRMLRNIAARLSGVVREVDIVARIGGDEFAAVLTDVTGRKAVREVVERMLEVVQKPVPSGGNQLQVGVSIGIALYPGDAVDLEQLLERADKAMYAAKRSEHTDYAFYSELGPHKVVDNTGD